MKLRKFLGFEQETGQSSFDMSSLSIFPTEVLEWITSVVLTSDQVRLWQCGDRILNIKLKNGGLKRTSLCWSRSCWMPWPRWFFTTFDSLEHIDWGVDDYISLCPTVEFNLLPKTLKCLHLDCDDVFLLLRIQKVSMNDVLPMLESLHLSGSSLLEENLKNLPSNLIELLVVDLQVICPSEPIKSSTIFCDLPRTIQRLTLGFSIVDESELGNDLPSELVSLNINCLDCNFNWFSKLPMSLKSLKIEYLYFKPTWDTLPSQLEELKLADTHIGSESVLQLPQSLKTLELWSFGDWDFDDGFTSLDISSLLPKNLTRLWMRKQEMPSDVLQHLPVSLTDFQVEISVDHPDVLSLFNPQTTRIELGLGDFCDKLNTFPFPPKLQYLSVYYINDDMCAMLPPGLEVLSFKKGLITTKGASKLPKSLTSLKAHLEVFSNNESMSYLRYISQIELTIKKTPLGELNENWLSSLVPSSSSPIPNHEFVYGCPYISENYNNYHLTSLVLETIPHVQKPLFDTLHKFKNLNTLKISKCGDISPDWLSLIPPTLTKLELFLTTYPSANQLSTLPRCLRYLSIKVGEEYDTKCCEWTDENLQSLPRSLHTFWTSATEFPNLTRRMYEFIPPYLQFSSLYDALIVRRFHPTH